MIDDASVTLRVSRVDRPDVVVLRLSGELDLSTAPHLSERIDEVVGDGRTSIVIDLEEVTFCDSTGMSAFIRGHHLSSAAGGSLRLTGAQGVVARVLKISGLDTLLGDDA
ncbi:STAS domain-containing protein [Asanoa sp. NPDC049573]|uniref:STAS domain-containing protein n=1 Tax=Asanoa sp. NPDC049573 TaxID=3155396 RepID=UPI00343B9B4E